MGKILLVKSLPFFNGIFKTCKRCCVGGKRPLGVLVGLNLITESVAVENDRWGWVEPCMLFLMGKILLVKSLPFFNGIFKTCKRCFVGSYFKKLIKK